MVVLQKAVCRFTLKVSIAKETDIIIVISNGKIDYIGKIILCKKDKYIENYIILKNYI